MALSAVSHASTSAAAALSSEAVPAASPFAQLLRSSRFATFDPNIRKTYYSPQQFVERGYWGLKRPITQRKKNSFITIKTWEARQHYVEWDNGEDQVRFMRRMEELDVRPAAQLNSAWAQVLGPARHNWLVDSEFSPHQWESAPKKEPQEIPIKSLGNNGSGEYGYEAGFRRPPSAVIPNVESMTPLQFKRHLAKMRSLRPAFQAYIKSEVQRQEEDAAAAKLANKDPPEQILLKDLSLLQIALIPGTPHYREFLARLTEVEYSTTKKIQPQPHRNGAFQYSHPSALDTLLYTKPKPGIVLQTTGPPTRFDQSVSVAHASTPDSQTQYVAAFAGLAAWLSRADSAGKAPLMNPEVDRARWANAVAELRPAPRRALFLRRVPRVVGAAAQGLDGVHIDLRVEVVSPAASMQRANPYAPGTRQYVAIESLEQPRSRAAPRADAQTSNKVGIFSTSMQAQVGSSLQNQPLRQTQDIWKRQAAQSKEANAELLNTLGVLIQQPDAAGNEISDDEQVPDDEL